MYSNSTGKNTVTHTKSKLQQLAVGSLFLFTLFFYYGTVLSGNMTSDLVIIRGNIQKIFWMPFIDCSEGDLLSPLDIFQNIVLFIPFGFLWQIAFSNQARAGKKLFSLVASAAILSCCAEILQLFTVTRITSITDVLLNTIGAVAGYSVFNIVKQRLQQLSTASAQLLDASTAFHIVVLFFYLILLLFEPFDFALDRWLLLPKIRTVFLTTGHLVLSKLIIILWAFLFLGLLVNRFAHKSVYVKNRILFCFMGIPLIFAIEGAMIINAAYTPSIATALIYVLAYLTGLLLYQIQQALLSRSPLFFFAYLSVVFLLSVFALSSCAPFHFTGEVKAPILIPLYSYYQQSTIDAVSDLVKKASIYLPVGFLCASAGLSTKRVYLPAILVSIYAGALEGMQLFLPGRVSDITDMFSAPALFLAGFLIYRKGLPFYQDVVKELQRT